MAGPWAKMRLWLSTCKVCADIKCVRIRTYKVRIVCAVQRKRVVCQGQRIVAAEIETIFDKLTVTDRQATDKTKWTLADPNFDNHSEKRLTRFICSN